jgi:hypothetical protein
MNSFVLHAYVIIIINNKLTNISDGENDNLYEGIN